ncbi:MAG: phasin family protein [Pseudomonadota bacterium]
MKERIENVLSRVADTARDGVNTAVDATQDRVGQASKLVANGKKPVQKVQKASLAVNAIAFRTSKELIELQAKSVQNSIDAVAGRLRDASRADTIRELLAQQRDVVPSFANQYVGDIKNAFGVVRSAVSELTGVTDIFKDAPVKKKAKAVAKKVSRKKPVRKTKAKAKAAASKVAATVTDAAQTAQSA